jgi:flagellar hook assembly protein FlgD
VFHGDLSLKPKMGPSNTKPVISSLRAVKGDGMSWTFTVTASDQDTNDGITSYDWYGTSYNSGKASPDSSSLSNTFSKTYTAAVLCTVRVEATDKYKARDYSEVIIKTDSGIVSTIVYTESETKHPSDAGKTLLSVCPNPFNPETQISVSLSSRSNILLKVFLSDGTLVSTLANKRFEAGKHSFTWNGSGYPTGIYILKLSTNSRSETCKLILTK